MDHPATRQSRDHRLEAELQQPSSALIARLPNTNRVRCRVLTHPPTLKPAGTTFGGISLRAPDELRDPLRDLSNRSLIATCARFRPSQANSALLDETTNIKIGLRASARQIQQLNTEIQSLYRRLDAQTQQQAPQLRAEKGVGPTVAAVVLMAWSHPGRIRSEAAFAALAGTNPIPIDSGRNQNQHRLNRSGDRQLNRALYTVALNRARHDQQTKDFIARKHAEGRTTRHARRCIKRSLARRFYRLLENPPHTT